MGMPGSYMSHIHAEDAASAVVYALKAAAGIYNIAEDEPMRRAALGNAVAAIEGVGQPSLPEPMSGEVPGSVEALMRSQRISNARFKDVTGLGASIPKHSRGLAGVAWCALNRTTRHWDITQWVIFLYPARS